MNKGSLFQYLNQSGSAEKKSFYEFVSSPYYNKNQTIVNFTGLILEYDKRKKQIEEHKEALHQNLWPKSEFNDLQLRHLFSDTLKLFERFKSVERQDQFQRQMNLLKDLLSSEQFLRFNKQWKKTKESLEKESFRNAAYHAQIYELLQLKDMAQIRLSNYAKDRVLQDKTSHLDTYYIAEKLKNSCEMRNTEAYLNVQYQYPLLDYIISHVEHHIADYKNEVAVYLYYLAYQTMIHGEQNDFYRKLVEQLRIYGNQLSEKEQQDIWIYALNFCVRKVNSGNQEFNIEVHDLHKTLLAKGVFYENDQISERHYKNIVTIALREKQFIWVQEFIENEKIKIPLEQRDNAYHFSLANYHFELKEYNDALQSLLLVHYSDVIYNLGTKTLLMKTYFELGESEPFFSLVEAFKKYVKRNDLLSEQKYSRYVNLFDFSLQLFRLKEKQRIAKQTKSIEMDALFNQILSDKEVSNKQWLNEKIKAIKNPLK